MTCIIGLVDKGNVYIGGDSAGVAGLSISIRSDAKVFQNSGFIFGITSSFRMGQLLRYKFDPPQQTVSQDDMQYMVTDFIDAVRKCFANNGFGDKDATVGGTFLVGYKGQLYTIQSDFQVAVHNLQYNAVGCGTDLALGSLHSTQNFKLSPETRVTMALEAAAKFSGGVEPPFLIIVQEQPKPPVTPSKKRAKKSTK